MIFSKLSNLQPIISIHRMGNFGYYHWGCILIHRTLRKIVFNLLKEQSYWLFNHFMVILITIRQYMNYTWTFRDNGSNLWLWLQLASSYLQGTDLSRNGLHLDGKSNKVSELSFCLYVCRITYDGIAIRICFVVIIIISDFY